jgi:DNA modification methylase
MHQGILQNNKNKTWFKIDGSLELIDFEGPSFFRFPKELAKKIIQDFCVKDGWVLDPFAGFGTTLIAAQELGRNGIGFEIDQERYNFSSNKIKSPSKIIHDKIENIKKYKLQKFDLIFTSPPYSSFRGTHNDPMEIYLQDFETIFIELIQYLAPNGKLVIEVSNVNDDRGIIPLAWYCGIALSKHLRFKGEIIRCNTGPEIAGPGFDHSYLLSFEKI